MSALAALRRRRPEQLTALDLAVLSAATFAVPAANDFLQAGFRALNGQGDRARAARDDLTLPSHAPSTIQRS